MKSAIIQIIINKKELLGKSPAPNPGDIIQKLKFPAIGKNGGLRGAKVLQGLRGDLFWFFPSFVHLFSRCKSP
jgi:hypothetical protein